MRSSLMIGALVGVVLINGAVAVESCGNGDSSLSALTALINNSKGVMVQNTAEESEVKMEDGSNFPLDLRFLASGGIQLSVDIRNQFEKDGDLKAFKAIDPKDIFSQGNKIVASKVAYLVDTNISKIKPEVFNSLNYYNHMYAHNILNETTTEHDSDFHCTKAIKIGSVNISQSDVYVKHKFKDGSNSNTIDANLLSGLATFDDSALKSSPDKILEIETNYCSDNRFGGGQMVNKFYPVGDKTLVISYGIASFSINSMLFKMISGQVSKSEEKSIKEHVRKIRTYLQN